MVSAGFHASSAVRVQPPKRLLLLWARKRSVLEAVQSFYKMGAMAVLLSGRKGVDVKGSRSISAVLVKGGSAMAGRCMKPPVPPPI